MNSISLMVIGLFFQIMYFHLDSVWVVCGFQGIGPFHLNYQFMSVKLLIVLLYYPFNGCRISSDTPGFILDTGDLYFLSFYLVSLSRGLCIVSILFSKNQFLLHWFSLYHMISTLYHFFSSVYFGFISCFF